MGSVPVLLLVLPVASPVLVPHAKVIHNHRTLFTIRWSMKSVCEFMCALTVQCVCLCVCGCVICILSNNLSNLCSFSQCQHGFCFRSIAGNQPSKSAANSWFTLWKWKQTIRFSHICICKEAHSERYKYFNLFWHSRDSIENLKKKLLYDVLSGVSPQPEAAALGSPQACFSQSQYGNACYCKKTSWWILDLSSGGFLALFWEWP